MKILYFIVLSVFIIVMLTSLTKTSEVISIYDYSKHTDEKEKPSRNDEEYHECSLYLYADKTFKIINQTGRLAPKYETKTGTWEIENEELVLQINQMKSTLFTVLNNKNSDDFTPMRGWIVLKKNLKQNLSDGVNIWEYRQGMRPEELFLKYVNANSTENPQGFNPEIFSIKLKFSIQLINKQPARKTLSKILPEGFAIDLLEKFEYYFKYKRNETVIAHLDHLDSKRITYVEIFEKRESLKDLNSFINKNYSFFAGEHNCFYYNDKKISILVILLERRRRIQISKYDL